MSGHIKNTHDVEITVKINDKIKKFNSFYDGLKYLTNDCELPTPSCPKCDSKDWSEHISFVTCKNCQNEIPIHEYMALHGIYF